MLDKWRGAWARLELTKPLIRLVLVRPHYTVQEVKWHTHLASGFKFFSRVKVVILFVSCYLTNWILKKLRTEISVLTESACGRLISFSNTLGKLFEKWNIISESGLNIIMRYSPVSGIITINVSRKIRPIILLIPLQQLKEKIISKLTYCYQGNFYLGKNRVTFATVKRENKVNIDIIKWNFSSQVKSYYLCNS